MRRMLARALVVGALFALGCGGDDGPANPNNNNGGGGGGGGDKVFTATIDGAAWTATSSTVQVTGSTDPRLATIVITGININNGVGVILTLSIVSGPGTYPLGVNPGSNAGGTGSVIVTPDSWLTPLNGAAGSVEITTRTATRIAGTFEFDASPLVPGPPDVAVTAGEFDITVASGLPALPNGSGGSLITATIGGDPWNAATISQVSGGASFGGTTTDYTVNFVGVVAPGAYDLGSGPGKWQCQVSRTGTAEAWAVTSEDSVGTIIFITILPGRMQGIFNGTIPSLNASAPLTLAAGFFSVYIGP